MRAGSCVRLGLVAVLCCCLGACLDEEPPWEVGPGSGKTDQVAAEKKPEPGSPDAGQVVRVTASPARVATPGSLPKGMVRVPAGTFWRGCNDKLDLECDTDEQPGRMVLLDDFLIDKSEVTVGMYTVCVKAGQCAEPATGTGCNYAEPNKGKHPVNCISWAQAQAFCHWAGKQLPTEAQWEKAARGPAGRKFPWGSDWAGCEQAVMNDGGPGCGRDQSWPVCSKSAGHSPYGACDMAGNVREWVADWYQNLYYRKSPESNPPGPQKGEARVQRGGAFDSDPWLLRTSVRGYRSPASHGNTVGFRCARSIPKT